MLNGIRVERLARKCVEARAKTSEPEKHKSINREFFQAKLAGL